MLNVLKTAGYMKTCSVANPKHRAVTYARSNKWADKLRDNLNRESILTLVPHGAIVAKSIGPMYVDDPEKEFILFHNWLNRTSSPPANKIGKKVEIDKSVIFTDAMKYIFDPLTMDEPLHMKHMGRIVIHEGVRVFSNTTIHRGSIDDTVIHKGVKIGSHCNIGHNVVIEKNTFVGPQVGLGGSSHIGAECFLGMGVIVRDGVKITDRVKVGMGSLVVKDITKPGVYFGSPVERKGPWDGKW